LLNKIALTLALYIDDQHDILFRLQWPFRYTYRGSYLKLRRRHHMQIAGQQVPGRGTSCLNEPSRRTDFDPVKEIP
jgi:hypothetical protein